jgi:5'-3' exonuclease
MLYKDTLLFIDFNHLCMRCFFVQNPEDIKEYGYQHFKFLVLNNIFKAVEMFDPTEVVIGIDGRKVWRKQVWKYYKINRKLKRDASDINWAEYFEACLEFEDELDKFFPFKIVKSNYAEADDIAGVLASWPELNDVEKILMTSDTDYIQLIQFPNVKVYDQKNKRYLNAESPKDFLTKKCIMGDKKDYVPGIREVHHWKPEFMRYCIDLQNLATDEESMKHKLEDSEDFRNHIMVKFMNEYGLKPSKVMGIGDKAAEKIIKNGELSTILEEKDFKARFKRNIQLIDLTKQPEKVKDIIKNKYINAEVGNCKKMLSYFVESGFTKFIEDVSYISMKLNKLKKEVK